MNNVSQEKTVAGNQEIGCPEYCPPLVRVMSEAEVLSAFQVNAAGTMAWWVA